MLHKNIIDEDMPRNRTNGPQYSGIIDAFLLNDSDQRLTHAPVLVTIDHTLSKLS
jgi:hypothetical protein